jgi:hypothetical protein
MKVGDKVKLIKTNNWKGWGFENSIIIGMNKYLIHIQSQQGHTMYVKHQEIVLL